MNTFREHLSEADDKYAGSSIETISLAATSLEWRRREAELARVGYENRSCVWSPDSDYIAWSCGRGRVKIIPWNKVKGCLLADDDRDLDGTPLKHDRIVRTFYADHPIHCLAFADMTRTSSTSRYKYRIAGDLILAAATMSGRIITWRVRSGRGFLVLVDHKRTVHDLQFANDGGQRLLSASADGSLKIWDLGDDGNMSHTLRPSSMAVVRACAWSPDNKTICGVGDQKGVYLWDVDTMTQRRLRGHHNTVSACTFCPDGFLLITASYDTTLIVWNVHTGQIQHTFNHIEPVPKEWIMGGYNKGHIRDISMRSNGRRIVTISGDSMLRMWDLLRPDSPPDVSVIHNGLSCCFSPGGASIAIGTTKGDLIIMRYVESDMNLRSICRLVIQCHVHITRYAEERRCQWFSMLPDALQSFLAYGDLIS